MRDDSIQNKKAWEYDAYNFWVRTAGTPVERASRDKENPKRMLKRYADYFDSFEGVKWLMQDFMMMRFENRFQSAVIGNIR